MTCPHCAGSLSEPIVLNGYLDAKKCNKCSGIWIPSYNYLRYLERGAETVREPVSVPASAVNDSPDGKTCPDCRKALIARKVGFGLEFRVERCDHCFGIWLDQGEWEQLTENQMESKINTIYSQFWQSQVRSQTEELLRIEGLKKLLGPARAQVVADFKVWLNQQDEKHAIKGYL